MIIKEYDIKTKQGVIVAKSWQPIENNPEQSAILLFHDSLGCIELWRTFPTVLSQITGRKIIAYDRLGFGHSDVRTDRMGLDFIEEEAISFVPNICEQLGLEHFIALGHSVGGAMAVNSAALHSKKCNGLITIAAQAFPEKLTLDSIREAKVLFQDQVQIDKLTRYHGPRARWVVDAWIETWLRPEFADWSLKSTLQKVTCPTLAIHGSEDEYGTKSHPEIIVNSVNGRAELEIMPDTHHVPHREKEKWVADRIARFLINL